MHVANVCTHFYRSYGVAQSVVSIKTIHYGLSLHRTAVLRERLAELAQEEEERMGYLVRPPASYPES